jgi:protein-S-isoprenylcysteine O-methyltransferase
MTEWISRFTELPAYGLAGLAVILLYVLQSELRFGARARTSRAGASDRRSTLVLSAAAMLPVLGFALAIKAASPHHASWIPQWFSGAVIPGMPLVAWIGIAIAVAGLALRLAAVLTLRERYTRTLLVNLEHPVARDGPYRWVRHPGYLGSLLTLNGVALASGNMVTLLASLAATSAAYAYRIKVEDAMLVTSLGRAYAEYRDEVRALLPIPRTPRRLS